MSRLIACVLCIMMSVGGMNFEKVKAVEIWGSGSAVSIDQLPEAFSEAAGTQIVLVDYEGRSKARISVYEKFGEEWYLLGEETAVVGKNGMGKTREGDGKTPLGVYSLETPFGILNDPGAQMPYTLVTEDLYWCATSGSEYYNKLVSAGETGREAVYPDEELIRYKGYYNYAMFIDYNREGAEGKGSCIFLHCTGAKSTTGGCVAVPEEFMRKILCWAREGTKIVLCE